MMTEVLCHVTEYSENLLRRLVIYSSVSGTEMCGISGFGCVSAVRGLVEMLDL